MKQSPRPQLGNLNLSRLKLLAWNICLLCLGLQKRFMLSVIPLKNISVFTNGKESFKSYEMCS